MASTVVAPSKQISEKEPTNEEVARAWEAYGYTPDQYMQRVAEPTEKINTEAIARLIAERDEAVAEAKRLRNDRAALIERCASICDQRASSFPVSMAYAINEARKCGAAIRHFIAPAPAHEQPTSSPWREYVKSPDGQKEYEMEASAYRQGIAADTARLDWLEESEYRRDCVLSGIAADGNTIREAIDAAMQKPETPKNEEPG